MGVDARTLEEVRSMGSAPAMHTEIPEELQTLLNQMVTGRVSAVTETLSEEPYNYDEWLEHLERPDHFLTNMTEAIEFVSALKRVKRKMVETGGDLYRALIRLRLPFLDLEEEQTLLDSPEWPEIRELMLLFEARFTPRIPGIVYRLERASAYLYKGESFVGMEGCYGFSDEIDRKGFTADTLLRGEAVASHSLGEGMVGPTFDALERAEGELLISTAGDALSPVRRVKGDLKDAERSHLRFVANVAQKLKIPCHITVGAGQFGLVITPGGKLVILGEAFERAEEGQGISKHGLEDVPDNSTIIYIDENDEVHYVKASDYSGEQPVPDKPGIQFFKGMRDSHLEDVKKNPAAILDGIRRQIALVASPVSREAIQSKETVERSAISLYVQAPLNVNNPDRQHSELLRWERQLYRTAKKYNAKVQFFTLGGVKKSGILIFGAQGSSQINKEERSARCANELLELEPASQIGLKEGAIHISNMSESDSLGVQELISNAVNGSQRLATFEGGSRIRMDESTHELFKLRGMLLKEGTVSEVELKSYGFQNVWQGDGFEIKEVNSYLREDKVAELVGLVGNASRDVDRQWNLTGELGAGQIGALQETARRLQSEYGMQIVVLPEHHDRGVYAGLKQILGAVFADLGEFEAWLQKANIGKAQAEIWKMMFTELHSGEWFLLEHPDYVKPEFSNLLVSLGENFGVACPDWGKIDSVSQQVILSSGVVLLAVDCPDTPNKVVFEGVPLREALKIVASYIQVDFNDLQGSEVAESLVRLVSNRGHYNPMVVTALTEDWIQKGFLAVGSTEFRGDLVDMRRRVPQLENIMSHYSDQLELAGSVTLLSIALALGDFSEAELRLAVQPPFKDLGPFIDELRKVGIFRQDEMAFRQSYFVTTGRQVQELKAERRYAMIVERNLRNAFFEDGYSIDKYLEVCGHLGVVWSKPTLELALAQVEVEFRSGDLLRVMDLGQQVLRFWSKSALNSFEVEDFSKLFKVFHNLIEAKMTLGENVEDELEMALEVVEEVPTRFKKDLFDDVTRLYDLRAEAMYRANRDVYAYADVVDEFRTHLRSGVQPKNPAVVAGSIHLHEAKLYYRQADLKDLPRERRVELIDGSLSRLRKILPLGIEPFDSDVRRLTLQAEGYRLLDLGESQTAVELTTYIVKVTEFLDSQESVRASQQIEANLQLALFLARAFMAPPHAPIDLDEGERVSRKIIERAGKGHFRDAGLKGYNYLINVPEIKANGLMAEGKYDEAYAEFERMEQMWEEMKALAAPLQNQESVAGTLLASHLTWAFGLMAQYSCLEKLGRSGATVLHKLKNQWEEIQVYEREHPKAWLKYTPYIPHLRAFLDSH